MLESNTNVGLELSVNVAFLEKPSSGTCTWCTQITKIGKQNNLKLCRIKKPKILNGNQPKSAKKRESAKIC